MLAYRYQVQLSAPRIVEEAGGELRKQREANLVNLLGGRLAIFERCGRTTTRAAYQEKR